MTSSSAWWGLWIISLQGRSQVAVASSARSDSTSSVNASHSDERTELGEQLDPLRVSTRSELRHLFLERLDNSRLMLSLWTNVIIAGSCCVISAGSFIPDILIAPSSSPPLLRGAPDYGIDTVLELTHRSATGNCEWRTCPRSLHGGYSGIRTRDLPDARHRTYWWTTMPHRLCYSVLVNVIHCWLLLSLLANTSPSDGVIAAFAGFIR